MSETAKATSAHQVNTIALDILHLRDKSVQSQEHWSILNPVKVQSTSSVHSEAGSQASVVSKQSSFTEVCRCANVYTVGKRGDQLK
jgi:hypothetical protein